MGTNIRIERLIYPYFLVPGRNKKQSIKGFPGIYRYSLDRLLRDIAETRSLGVDKIILFGVPQKKDPLGSSAYAPGNLIAQGVRSIKSIFPDLTVATDVCLCAYTWHGHCGILKSPSHQVTKSQVNIDQEKTLEQLAKIAVSYAQAGADWVAPSAMAKQQVLAIRKALQNSGSKKTKILGYSAKFASNFYGPFRNAAGSAPRFGDRSGYQLNYADAKAPLKEIDDDLREGADLVMVKPALSYLDIIKSAKERSVKPLVAYNVSGEYALVKYGSKQGLYEEKKIVEEIFSSIQRAGADYIISYHAKEFAGWKKEN